MSTRDRLSRLTADLVSPSPTESPRAPNAPAPDAAEVPAAAPQQVSGFPPISVRPAGRKTGPGEMLAFRGQMIAAEGEVQSLRQRLEQYAESSPTKKLDPKTVRPSAWANRHEASYGTPEFIRFKEEIEHSGGNVQPILVRPAGDHYELIFGHRRHRACLELGLPVLALIWTTDLTDHELFALMDRENRERADLTAWEQGSMYRRALEEQLFPSQRRLAEALGVSHTWVRKAVSVAELPEPLVQCFRSPLELTFRHAETITAALETDRKGVLRRAEKLRQADRMSASSVVSALVGKQRGRAETRELKLGSKVAARLVWDERGQASLRFQPGVLHADNVEAILAAVAQAIGTPGDGSTPPGGNQVST
jgi:ParB family chromosome partitioning protein